MRKASPLTLVLAAWLLAGCGSQGLAGAARQAIGLRKAAALPEAQQAPRIVSLRLHASSQLNLDTRGRPLALAVRLYQLRQKDAFERAPYSAFLSPEAERASLGQDLLEVREIMLVPGQRYEVREKVGRETAHLAVVALFQRPAGQRWRTAVAAADAQREGLTLVLHACAMTVGGKDQAALLSSVRCQ